MTEKKCIFRNYTFIFATVKEMRCFYCKFIGVKVKSIKVPQLLT